MLYIWKFINNTPEPRGNKIHINPADGENFGLASFLVPTQEGSVTFTITTGQIKFKFVAKYNSKEEIEEARENTKEVEERSYEAKTTK